MSNVLSMSRYTKSQRKALPGDLPQTAQRDTPYHGMSYSGHKLGGFGQELPISVWGHKGHRSVGGENHLFLLGFVSPSLSFSLLLSLMYFFKNHFVQFQLLKCLLIFHLLLNFPPHQDQRGVSEWLCGTQLLAGVKPHQKSSTGICTGSSHAINDDTVFPPASWTSLRGHCVTNIFPSEGF